jgi:hypothetical protein
MAKLMNRIKQIKKEIPDLIPSESYNRKLYFKKNGEKPTRVSFYLYEDDILILQAHIFSHPRQCTFKYEVVYLTSNQVDKYMEAFCLWCWRNGFIRSEIFSECKN